MAAVPQDPRIREALPCEANSLSELAMRSKAYWGYPQDFMNACRRELMIVTADIETRNRQYCVAVYRDEIVGFYALKYLSADESELDALFVEPACIGTGIGCMLIEHAKRELSQRGVARMTIQGDPNATEFYLAVGGRQVGVRESASIPGRYLPLFEIAIVAA